MANDNNRTAVIDAMLALQESFGLPDKTQKISVKLDCESIATVEVTSILTDEQCEKLRSVLAEKGCQVIIYQEADHADLSIKIAHLESTLRITEESERRLVEENKKIQREIRQLLEKVGYGNGGLINE